MVCIGVLVVGNCLFFWFSVSSRWLCVLWILMFMMFGKVSDVCMVLFVLLVEV